MCDFDSQGMKRVINQENVYFEPFENEGGDLDSAIFSSHRAVSPKILGDPRCAYNVLHKGEEMRYWICQQNERITHINVVI